MEGVSPEFKVSGSRLSGKCYKALASKKGMVKTAAEELFFSERLGAHALNCGFFFNLSMSSEKMWNDEVFASPFASRINQTRMSEMLLEPLECAENQKMSARLNRLNCSESKAIDYFRIVFKNLCYLKPSRW